MDTEEILQWAGGIIVTGIGWLMRDRIEKMDKELDALKKEIDRIDHSLDTKVSKEDLKDLIKPLREDMTYIRQRVDQAIDRRGNNGG